MASSCRQAAFVSGEQLGDLRVPSALSRWGLTPPSHQPCDRFPVQVMTGVTASPVTAQMGQAAPRGYFQPLWVSAQVSGWGPRPAEGEI